MKSFRFTLAGLVIYFSMTVNCFAVMKCETANGTLFSATALIEEKFSLALRTCYEDSDVKENDKRISEKPLTISRETQQLSLYEVANRQRQQKVSEHPVELQTMPVSAIVQLQELTRVVSNIGPRAPAL